MEFFFSSFRFICLNIIYLKLLKKNSKHRDKSQVSILHPVYFLLCLVPPVLPSMAYFIFYASRFCFFCIIRNLFSQILLSTPDSLVWLRSSCLHFLYIINVFLHVNNSNWLTKFLRCFPKIFCQFKISEFSSVFPGYQMITVQFFVIKNKWLNSRLFLCSMLMPIFNLTNKSSWIY